MAKRWFISALCGLSILTGCYSHTSLARGISAQAAHDGCKQPVEHYEISPMAFPISAIMMRHSNCLGVDDLLMVVWLGDRSEVNVIAARMLSLMYVQNYNSLHPNEQMSIEKLKIDELKVDDEETYMMFSRLAVEKVEKQG